MMIFRLLNRFDIPTQEAIERVLYMGRKEQSEKWLEWYDRVIGSEIPPNVKYLREAREIVRKIERLEASPGPPKPIRSLKCAIEAWRNDKDSLDRLHIHSARIQYYSRRPPDGGK